MGKFLKKFVRIISDILFYILLAIIIIFVAYLLIINSFQKQDRLGDIPINFYTILTQSMYPKIQAGDIVITYRNNDNKYNVGDVITFVSNTSSSGITITHRIVEIQMENGRYVYITKGDNNSSKDTKPVLGTTVIGKVVVKIPKAGFVQQFLVTKVGFLVAIVLPCLGIIIYDAIKICKKVYGNTMNRKNAKEKLKKIDSSEENDISKIDISKEEAKENLKDVIDGTGSKKIEEQVNDIFESNGISKENILEVGDDNNEDIEVL